MNEENEIRPKNLSAIREVVDATFERDVLDVSGLPVLVEFWAEWCAPCKLQLPIINSVIDHYGTKLKVYRLDVDNNAETTQRYGIKGIPTVIVFRDGKEVERIVGVVSKEVAIKMIDKYTGETIAAA